ncbi:hypothetical protein OH799_03765 [Nocardia sp. NBC_00881]|uniref:hypothetical protein n=1 Tax=Nocardia sp. NBC_00881 TaxID=2975995 RepID=UPI00386E5482|nr:hypothetical protein OH799_03765 [Nocardia sp. NBC_00881]
MSRADIAAFLVSQLTDTRYRLRDAVDIFKATITVENTRSTYAAALEKLVADFGADTDVALLGEEPHRVSGWFTFVWGGKAAKTFNIRLTALGRGPCVHTGVDEIVRPYLGSQPRQTHSGVRRGLCRYQADSDPAARRRPCR